MIFGAASTDDGRPVALIGLSDENVRRMIEGYPVSVDCTTDDVGVEVTLVIWGGWADEAELRDYLDARFDVNDEGQGATE